MPIEPAPPVAVPPVENPPPPANDEMSPPLTDPAAPPMAEPPVAVPSPSMSTPLWVGREREDRLAEGEEMPPDVVSGGGNMKAESIVTVRSESEAGLSSYFLRPGRRWLGHLLRVRLGRL